ncbi:MAG: GNAT family N-acetyltransferase [Candidatus Spyradocola sp.]
MISFRAITENNFSDILSMKRPESERFVASNAVSLAQAWLYRDNGDVFPCAIYADETPVGFLLLDEDADERILRLWRILFPPEHERKGYGTEAVRLLIRLAARSGKYDCIQLDCAADNAVARHVYDKLGFTPTGDVNHGDEELRRVLTDADKA